MVVGKNFELGKEDGDFIIGGEDGMEGTAAYWAGVKGIAEKDVLKEARKLSGICTAGKLLFRK